MRRSRRAAWRITRAAAPSWRRSATRFATSNSVAALEALVRRESVVRSRRTNRPAAQPTVAVRHAMESALEIYFRQRRISRLIASLHSRRRGRTAPVRLLRCEVAPRLVRGTGPSQRRSRLLDEDSPRGLDDDFFDDLATDSTIARMSRIEPGWWWRSFFAKLQAEVCKTPRG